MKIKLILVGKTTDGKLAALIEEYTNRLRFYIPFEQIILPELKNAKNLPLDQQKEKEGNAILARLDNSDEVILLDEKGKQFSSVDFAAFISRKMIFSNKSMVFVVGGPYGFSPGVYQRADSLLSLSKMTFSHQMVRLFVIEQIYRGFTILRNEPYHHQ